MANPTHIRRKARRRWKSYWKEEVPEDYNIHHVDRNYRNPDIANLALLTMKNHTYLHGKNKNDQSDS